MSKLTRSITLVSFFLVSSLTYFLRRYSLIYYSFKLGCLSVIYYSLWILRWNSFFWWSLNYWNLFGFCSYICTCLFCFSIILGSILALMGDVFICVFRPSRSSANISISISTCSWSSLVCESYFIELSCTLSSLLNFDKELFLIYLNGLFLYSVDSFLNLSIGFSVDFFWISNYWPGLF